MNTRPRLRKAPPVNELLCLGRVFMNGPGQESTLSGLV